MSFKYQLHAVYNQRIAFEKNSIKHFMENKNIFLSINDKFSEQSHINYIKIDPYKKMTNHNKFKPLKAVNNIKIVSNSGIIKGIIIKDGIEINEIHFKSIYDLIAYTNIDPKELEWFVKNLIIIDFCQITKSKIFVKGEYINEINYLKRSDGLFGYAYGISYFESDISDIALNEYGKYHRIIKNWYQYKI